MLQLYNCTAIYIVSTGTVLRSVTFILAAIFLALMREKSEKNLRMPHKSPFVIVLNFALCSLDVNISAVRTTASDKGQEFHWSWKMRPYRLRRVQLQSSQHCSEK